MIVLTIILIPPRSDEELAAGFQRIPNRRTLPDYFDVISNPVAFSTIRVSKMELPNCQTSRLTAPIRVKYKRSCIPLLLNL